MLYLKQPRVQDYWVVSFLHCVDSEFWWFVWLNLHAIWWFPWASGSGDLSNRTKVMASLENEPCYSPSASAFQQITPPSNVCMQKFRLYETLSVMLSSSFYCFAAVVVVLVCCLLGISLILSRDLLVLWKLEHICG